MVSIASSIIAKENDDSISNHDNNTCWDKGESDVDDDLGKERRVVMMKWVIGEHNVIIVTVMMFRMTISLNGNIKDYKWIDT